MIVGYHVKINDYCEAHDDLIEAIKRCRSLARNNAPDLCGVYETHFEGNMSFVKWDEPPLFKFQLNTCSYCEGSGFSSWTMESNTELWSPKHPLNRVHPKCRGPWLKDQTNYNQEEHIRDCEQCQSWTPVVVEGI